MGGGRGGGAVGRSLEDEIGGTMRLFGDVGCASIGCYARSGCVLVVVIELDSEES